MPKLNSTRSTRRTPALLFLGATLLTGCGLGTASISSSGGDSSSNAATTASALTVMRSITSPATISFELNDQEGDPADVNISFDVGGGFLPITLAAGSGSLTGIPSNGAAPIEVPWDFATDLGDESFRGDIAIQLNVVGGLSPAVLTGVSQGNDPPQVSEAGSGLAPPESQVEFSGNIDVDFLIRDSGSDRVRIMVEYRSFEDEVASSYWLARSAAVPGSQVTPTYAFVDFLTEPEDTLIEFRWDSVYAGTPPLEVNDDAQLAGKEFDVQFRFTVEDLDSSLAPTGQTSVAETERFRVDNNEPPSAVLEDGEFVLSAKDRGNIPLSFTIFDDESDEVEVVVQWRALGEQFPVLPGNTEELLDLLNNPARARDRRDAHIAEESPPAFTGRVGLLPGLSATEVRLPELASSAAGLLAHGVGGRTLEIMRPTSAPEPLAWTETPLNGPVASLLLGDASSALILDSSPSGWRVRDIDLESGAVRSTLAEGDGEPRALAVDPPREHFFVASSSAISRFDLFTGQALGRVGHSLTDGPRGIAALGSDLVVATSGSSLIRFDLAAETKARLLTGLCEPWGIALDPNREGSVYVSERAANRIVSIDLDELAPRTLVAEVAAEDLSQLGNMAIPSPANIALEHYDSRVDLLVLCDEGSAVSLRRLELDRANGSGSGAPFVREITDLLTEADAGLSVGADHMRIVCSRLGNELAIGGGVLQRRRIVEETQASGLAAYEPHRQVVRLEEPFGRTELVGMPWRIRAPLSAAASPTGRASTFIWDSSEVPDVSQVQVQVTPIDNDPATSASPSTFRSYRSGFERHAVDTLFEFSPQLVALDLDGDGDLDLAGVSNTSGGAARVRFLFQDSPGNFSHPGMLPILTFGAGSTSMIAVDMDGDGLQDLVTSHSDSGFLRLIFQDGLGSFDPCCLINLQPGASPRHVAAADLDGDGDIDLASANKGSDDLTLFFQDSPGHFSLGQDRPFTGSQPVSVTAADLDGDGDVDLVSANSGSDDLTLIFQTSAGNFTPSPSPLLAGLSPMSVQVADLDNDGDLDLVSTNTDSRDLSLFFQHSPGIFAGSSTSLPTGDSHSSTIAADLDGNGTVDLVSVSELNALDDLRFYFQAATGTFEAETVETPSQTFNIQPAAVADLDGDNDLDFVGPNGLAPSLRALFQTSPGVFVAADLSLPTGDEPYFVAAADLDGDGDVDIVSANASSADVSVFFQDSSGTFVPLESPLPVGDSPTSIAVADLDQDGDMDLATANSGSSSLTLLLQETPGEFVPSTTTLAGGEGCFSVVAVDLDQDGDMDLVSANALSDDLTIFYQELAGEFTSPPVTLAAGEGPGSLIAADLDQDGDMDLASANRESNDLTVFLQTSPGVFEANGAPLTTGNTPVSLAAADLDGDGDMDLVCSNFGTAELTLFFQTHPGVFDSAQFTLPLSGFFGGGVTAADFDGDGDVDLLGTGNGFPSNLTLFWNGR